MATYNKIYAFVADVCQKVHNLSTSADVLKVALSNSATVATNTVLANLTEISYTNCSTRNLAISASSQSSGTFKLVITDLVLTASGTVGPFRYVTIYNSTAGSGNLVAWYDYGSSITLNNGDTFTLDFDGTNGFFQLV